MKASNDPSSVWHSWLMRNWATPFSGFRWSIRKLARTGRAIYLDIDMILMTDIASSITRSGNRLFASPEPRTFCCTLWDCERAKHFFRGETTQNRVWALCSAKNKFPPGNVAAFANGNWNCLTEELQQHP